MDGGLTRGSDRTIKGSMLERRPPIRRIARGIAAALALAALGSASGARADDYDPQRAGHPARVVAYALHPIGVMLDLLIFRPAHWVGSLPGVDKFFGHEPYTD